MTDSVVTRHGSMAVERTGTGPPVLLLHGVPGSRRSWADVVPLLADDAAVVVPDLLGFGDSARPSDLRTLHAQGQAEALLDVLDALALDRAAVVGHDFGGPVALRLLALAPERVSRLGLLATNAFTDTPIPPPLNLVRWPIVGGIAARVLMSGPALRMMLRTGAGPGARLAADAYLGDADQQRSIRTIFAGSLRDLPGLYGPVQEAIENAHVPGFVAWGDRDPFFPVAVGRRTADALGAPFLLLPGAGHFLPAERPGDVAIAVRDLLAVEPLDQTPLPT
ncbi:MAG TPA: alpha/beta hydrolase [Mycobacteriales bacterium]|nr:alpha/beta hydrolase [Mycobacteriales bacterium]